MERKDSLIIFIFLLIVNLYFYFVKSTFFQSVSILGDVIFLVFLAVILCGLFITSIKELNPYLYFCYFGLFVVSLIVLVFHLLSLKLSAVVEFYVVLATLVVLFLAMLDFRESILSKKAIMRYLSQIKIMKQDIDTLQSKLGEQKNLTASFKAKSELNASNLRKTKQDFTKINKEVSMQERAVLKQKKETKKQTELKQQYSKSLRNIRKHKKEEEELLIVSSDGTKVHRPKCVAVRHLLKDKRKLIKDWKTAQKEGYKTCNLCKPHVKDKTIQKNNIQYKFVASKESDKLHKASCLLAKNINSKEMVYFKTYRAGLKKGYTACRICISGK